MSLVLPGSSHHDATPSTPGRKAQQLWQKGKTRQAEKENHSTVAAFARLHLHTLSLSPFPFALLWSTAHSLSRVGTHYTSEEITRRPLGSGMQSAPRVATGHRTICTSSGLLDLDPVGSRFTYLSSEKEAKPPAPKPLGRVYATNVVPYCTEFAAAAASVTNGDEIGRVCVVSS